MRLDYTLYSIVILISLVDVRVNSQPAQFFAVNKLNAVDGLEAFDWDILRTEVDGRLLQGDAFAGPCHAEFNSSECAEVRDQYVDGVARANTPGGYIQTQWETCQTIDEHCLLDYRDPHNEQPVLSGNCRPGSIPDYFIDVRTAQDVKAAFAFANRTGIPVVVKNTGHDYKGRSSAPGSLGLWMHNLKNITYNPEFTPEGCSSSSPGVTIGAGVQWVEAYGFAEENNITIVGGSDRSVGAVGGWLQGGGHGALSNTMGLGVDRVLQYKVVTPDGILRVANECQNEDLFFALRGGGGGTFGAVLDATVLASPPVKLQTIILAFPPGNVTRTTEAWSILADNGLKWADEGWGGFSMAHVVIFLNPVLTPDKAAESMAPLIDFGKRIQAEGGGGVKLIVTEFATWGSFFEAFSKDFVATVGSSLALASRLVSKDNFGTPGNREALVSGLLAANAATPGLIILISAPSSFPHSGKTSVTEAWRTSVYHVTVVSPWNWNATKEEKRGHYQKVSESIDNLRRITPDAAYLNEADVYEPNHQVAFWGEHYPRLLEIKHKYDPHHLLDCWHCVGWNPSSSRFRCYLDTQTPTFDASN